MLFLVVALLLYAAYFVYHAFNVARARGELNYAESTWLFAALRVRHGLMPYFDYTQAPYIPMVYSPLLPALTGWIGALFGISDRQTITLSRLVSLGSALAIGGLIALICRIFRAGTLHSIIAGLLFLTPQVTFALWSLAARSDMLAVALSLGAVAVPCLTARRGSPPPYWSLVIAGVLCGLALAAKQTAVAPLLGLGLWIVFGGAGASSWSRRIGQISLLTLGWLAGFTAIIAPFGMEGARLFLQGTLDLATHPQSAADFYTRLDDLVKMLGLCFPISVLGIWAMFRDRESRETPVAGKKSIELFLLYGVSSAAIFLATSAKLGSASSYALELVAVLCVAAGMGISVLERLFDSAERPAQGLGQVAMALFLLALVPLYTQTWYAIKMAQSAQEIGPNDEPLAVLAQTSKGPVLSENGYILLNGAEPPYLLDPLFFSVQEQAGKWNPAPVLRMVEERKFVSVVLFHTIESRISVNGIPWMPDGLYDAIGRNYALAGVQGRYYVYLPRNP